VSEAGGVVRMSAEHEPEPAAAAPEEGTAATPAEDQAVEAAGEQAGGMAAGEPGGGMAAEAGGMDEGEPAGPNPRALRAVRGVFAATLVLEALSVLFVPRAIAQFGTGLTALKLTLVIALVVLLIVAAGLIGRRAGLVLGSVLQLGLIACGLLTGAMYVLGVVFAAIWLYELQIRRQLLGLS
jgi:hypothetical protein